MKLYNFSRLITKYGVNFYIIKTKCGKYIDGYWQEGKKETIKGFGAIIPLAEKKLYQQGGNYTSKDKQLYTFKSLSQDLKDVKVLYKKSLYSVEQETDYSDYSDVFVYLLKYISLFNDKSGDEID